MSVLKGASAAALYGSRAGNGVILITTKKGKEIQVWELQFPHLYLLKHYLCYLSVRQVLDKVKMVFMMQQMEIAGDQLLQDKSIPNGMEVLG